MQKEKVTVVGSVLAAIGASTCCIGPLVALVLGFGGARLGQDCKGGGRFFWESRLFCSGSPGI